MKILILALALCLAVQCAHPEKQNVKKVTVPAKKETAHVHMVAKTVKTLRMLKKKKKEDDDCDSCGEEKKEQKEQKEQSGELGILKAEVLTLTTSNNELKTQTATMETELKTLETEVKEIKECCNKNKEGLDKVKEEEKKDGGEIAKLEQKVWDKKVNRLAKAKLLINYKPDWTVYVSSNYPMEKQNKALQPLDSMDDDKTFLNETPYSQFVGGTADLRKRMFSIIDMGEKVQVSRLVYFSTWGATYLFLTKIAVHYYTPDNEFDISKPNGADFTLLKEQPAKKCTYTAKGSNALFSDPGELVFDAPIMTRYLMVDLNNEQDSVGCKCCTAAGFKAYS